MINHTSEDFAPVMPYLTVKDGQEALAFYERAFGAETVLVVPMENGTGVLHARFFVNGSMVMLCEETPDIPTGVAAPQTIGGTPVTIRLRLRDASSVHRIFERAIAAAAVAIQVPVNKPWGERYARLQDPAGHVWALGGPIDGQS